MTAVRVTLSGLLNLVAMKFEVRAASLGVLATGRSFFVLFSFLELDHSLPASYFQCPKLAPSNFRPSLLLKVRFFPSSIVRRLSPADVVSFLRSGLAHPRTAHSMVLKTANEITALNPEYSIALIREGSLAFGLVEDPFQQRLLLDFFGAWVSRLSLQSLLEQCF